MAVIKEIKNGSGGIIRIHDDYCKNNTPEDNQKIIDNVSRIINDYYIRKSVGSEGEHMISYPEFKKLLKAESDLQKRKRLINLRKFQYSQEILKAVMPVYGNDIDYALAGLDKARDILVGMKAYSKEVEDGIEEADR